VQQALALDETLGEAHSSLAFILLYFELDWAGAEREYKRAMELGADVHHKYGLYLSEAGRHTEAIAEMKRAVELDPLTLPTRLNLGYVYMHARQYDLAIEQYRNLLDLSPNGDLARLSLGTAYVYQRRYDEGLAEIQRVIATRENAPVQSAKSRLAWAYAQAGKRSEALKLLDELKPLAQQSPALTVMIARTYAVLGERDQAIDWLERAYQVRAGSLLSINGFPEFDSLHSDPRWKELLRRMNFPEEQHGR